MKKLLFVLMCSLLMVSLLYGVWFGYLWYVSMPIYYFTKEANSYTANMYKADASLGHTLKANAQGYYVWGYGDSIVVNTDERGNRTATGKASTGGLLYFGDSFTLCEELNVDEAYPYILGEALCQPVSNTAVSGYGYAQMVLKARQWVSAVIPQAVVFQVSPWLAERAVTPYMPALFFKVPSPYYSHGQTIEPPYYTSPVFELTQNQLLDKYRQSEVSFADKLGFVWRFTRPVFKKQYWEEAKLTLGLNSLEKTKLEDAETATELAIKEMISLCQGRKLILLVMGYAKDETEYFQSRFGSILTENVIVVNADKILWGQPLITDQASYEKAYCFWHGDPPVLIDYHFNAHANQLITTALLNAINGTGLSACP